MAHLVEMLVEPMGDSNTQQTAESHQGLDAMHQVFGILELSEQIFLELPIKDLLVNAQRVSKSWRDVITGSVKLQQALFLVPLSGPSLHFMVQSRVGTWQDDGDNPNSYTVLMNPLFDRVLRSFNRNDVSNQPESTWRQMLVSQPPIRVTPYINIDLYGHRVVAFNRPGIKESPREYTSSALGFNALLSDIPRGYIDSGLLFDALTFGDIDDATSLGPDRYALDLKGYSLWKKVEYGHEVRRIAKSETTKLR